MAVNDQTVELKTQELVFIGNLFLEPDHMSKYATFIESNDLISTEPAKSIWSTIYKHYMEYGALPCEEDFLAKFGEKGKENLDLGIAIAGSEETRASFILDTFHETMRTNIYKQASSKLATIYEDGHVDNEKAKEVLDSVYSKLAVIDQSESFSTETDLRSVVDQWKQGQLVMQQPRVPVPLPGLDFMQGSPVGSVNVIVGAYGSGKSAMLCAMAAYLSQTVDVLYVTLETPASTLGFRILSNYTEGAMPSNYVFLDPNSVYGEDRSLVKEKIVTVDEAIADRRNIYFLDVPAGSISPAQLDVYLRELRYRIGKSIPVMIVDYAALMKTNSGAGREDIGWGYTGVILKELAAVAKRRNMVIWAAAQAGGDKAHTFTTASMNSYKPLRGYDLYGSKEVLQDASLVLGMSFVRSSSYPRMAVGIISTIKNRYGDEFYDYICSVDYSKAKFEIHGALVDLDDAERVDAVLNLLRSTEMDLDRRKQLMKNKMKSESASGLSLEFESTGPVIYDPSELNSKNALYSRVINRGKKPSNSITPEKLAQEETNSQDASYPM